MRLVSVAEMRDLEQRTFASGISEAELQARAGRAVARVVTGRYSRGAAVALVGTGNNGRDAWIAARTLVDEGWSAGLYLTPRHAISEAELREFVAAGGRVIWHPEDQADLGVASALQGATVVVDGLLGIGARGAPRSPLAEIIAALNDRRDASQRVVSVDVPSGLDADVGSASLAVRADVTVVLGGMKRGLVAPSALDYVGELVPADIGVVDGPTTAPELITREAVSGLLPPRPRDAHKGSFGRLLVVAGSANYIGASYLTCAAAVRTGAGITCLAAMPTLRDVVASRLPEATFLPLPEGGAAEHPEESAARVAAALDRFDALAIGPGLSTDGGVGEFVEAVLRVRANIGMPAVVDADGLNLLAQRPDWPSWIGPEIVMTPHVGELRRLAPDVDQGGEPWELAGSLAHRWGVTLLLKGPCTAIGSGASAWVHARPNPALATGGTGDVLTGIIGGLLARGLGPPQAARAGVWTHGAAGAEIADQYPAGGLAASDLLGAIPSALASLSMPA